MDSLQLNKAIASKVDFGAHAMVKSAIADYTEMIWLSGISWQTYEALREELRDRRVRLTFNRGDLELMAPSPEHELNKKLMGRFVETLAEEYQRSIYPLGSTTLRQPELVGAEPDECFYLRNIEAVRGKTRLNFEQDPPPDLVLEIDLTSSSEKRLPIYAELGISEVWIFDGKTVTLQILHGTRYELALESLFFPEIQVARLVDFLTQAATMDYLDVVRSFRQWVRSQLNFKSK